MITLLTKGTYTLLGTKDNSKILSFDKNERVYSWIVYDNTGELKHIVYKHFDNEYLISVGKYRMYEVKDEINFSDAIHLEFLVGDGVWQGHLLREGLPNGNENHYTIAPTKELISRSIH